MNDRVVHPLNLLKNFDAAIGSLGHEGIALVTDFDGTLSEFVPVLEDAVIYPQVLPPLRSLAGRLALTSVISGRSASDVERRVGIEGIMYIGNHGAERIEDGVPTAVDGVETAESRLQELLEFLARAADDGGLVLENKKYSASLHYRRASDEAGVVRRLQSALRDLQDDRDFQFFWGNKILEIRCRNGVNKGTALASLIETRRPQSVVFLGDDTTDADALRVLRQCRASGIITGFGIAVIQEGTPDSVLDSADYSLNGVPEVAEFLRRLDIALS